MSKDSVVNTVVRDDFFNDPFFSDWWGDFDVPSNFKISLTRQISGINQNI